MVEAEIFALATKKSVLLAKKNKCNTARSLANMTARVSGQEEFQTGEDEVGLKHSIIPLIEKQVRNGYILIQCDKERASRVHSIKS